MTEGTFRFVPSARLQKFLGNELIADPNLAILEFVKNCYDAGANHVLLRFAISTDPTSLTIADDGVGMDRDEFEANWMHPGFSFKAADGPAPPSPLRQTDRTPVGEKGLGRLAAGRLGAMLDVFSRKSPTDAWLHVEFEWVRFDDMTKALTDITVPYDFTTEPPAEAFEVGTVVVIKRLSQRWDQRIRGRPLPGRSRTRLGRLKQDLGLLVRPFESVGERFEITLDSDLVAGDDDIGTVSPEDATPNAGYRFYFEFVLDSSGDGVVKRRLERSEEIVTEFGGPPVEEFQESLGAKTTGESTSEPLRCGPFTGVFLYSPPAAARRALEIDAVGHGVLLYRDKVLVEPYGLDGNDWVGVEARKAQRQGYALVQPVTFSGHVLIGRDANPQLRDMANRQGLLANEASEEFLERVRAEFAFFEEQVFEELSQRWQSKELQAEKVDREILEAADVRLRAVAHSLGQPLFGLAATVSALKSVAARPDLPEELREVLSEIVESALAHLQVTQRVVRRFLDVRKPERSETSTKALLDAVYEDVAPLADSMRISLQWPENAEHTVFVSRELALEAIKELVSNAIQAPRPEGRTRRVALNVREVEGDVLIEIADDATGIPGAAPDTPLTSIRSTRGRPGEGLATVELSLRICRGSARIVETSSAGTRFEVRLPTRLSGLRKPV